MKRKELYEYIREEIISELSSCYNRKAIRNCLNRKNNSRLKNKQKYLNKLD
jgi:hypothetical protein